jgi:hypothetical protein
MATAGPIIESAQPEVGDTPSYVDRREDTRTIIAKVFVFSYLVLILILILLTSFAKLPQDAAKDYLLAISSPLGFVIGFYFKSTQSS